MCIRDSVTASTATIQGKSTDNVRIDHYEIKIGTQSFKSTSGLQDVTGLSKKTEYNVEIVAVDPSGNRSDTARATFMTLDTSAENNTWQKDVYKRQDCNLQYPKVLESCLHEVFDDLRSLAS